MQYILSYSKVRMKYKIDWRRTKELCHTYWNI